MASMQFERVPAIEGGKNMIRFDSSPDRSIARAFGWAEGTVRLEKISEIDGQINYTVYAAEREGDRERKRGILKQITRDELLRRQDAVYFGRPFH